MRHRYLAVMSLAVVAVVFVSLPPVAAQAPAGPPRAKTAAAEQSWTPARTADGHPDLQGTWENNSTTPLERPKVLEGREYLTDAEVAALKKRYQELFVDGGDAGFGEVIFETALSDAKKFTTAKLDEETGNYNSFWMSDRYFENRTSLIIDPPNGKIPPLTPITPEERKRRAAAAEYRKLHPADGPEDLGVALRCVNFGIPKIGAGYNSYQQIFQSRDHVAILNEIAHDVRIVPVDGRPHLPQHLRQWNGDSRGRWEGDTLVIETSNFSHESNFRGSKDNLHLVERFTRIGPDTLQYDVTIEDPAVWTRPWTVRINLRRTDALIYEYACHEGNLGLVGVLSAARAEEKAAAEAAQRGSDGR